MAENDKFADEMLTDDELDNVSGGGFRQCIGDGKFLVSMGYMSLAKGEKRNYLVAWNKCSAELDAGWAKAGVMCITKFLDDNMYIIDGKKVSRKDAFAHVLRQKGYSKDEIVNYGYDQHAGSF